MPYFILLNSPVVSFVYTVGRRLSYWQTSVRFVLSVRRNSSGVHNSSRGLRGAASDAGDRGVGSGSGQRVVGSWPGPYFFARSSYSASVGPLRCLSSVLCTLYNSTLSQHVRTWSIGRQSPSINFRRHITLYTNAFGWYQMNYTDIVCCR